MHLAHLVLTFAEQSAATTTPTSTRHTPKKWKIRSGRRRIPEHFSPLVLLLNARLQIARVLTAPGHIARKATSRCAIKPICRKAIDHNIPPAGRIFQTPAEMASCSAHTRRPHTGQNRYRSSTEVRRYTSAFGLT